MTSSKTKTARHNSASKNRALGLSRDGTEAVTLSQSVTEKLRTAILEGRFASEARLQEELLAETLAVSRTPIRAALHTLSNEGLLDYIPNRGYSVRKVDTERLGDIFDVREALESLAARLAAEKGMSDSDQEEFMRTLKDGDRILSKGKLLPEGREGFSAVNERLHEAIIRVASNQMLTDAIRVCYNIPMSSDRNVLWRSYEWIRRSHDDHHRLFEAICARDGGRAERLMREHVLSVKQHMREQLDAGEGAGAAAGPAPRPGR
jgi:GntR family transcriptional regulator of vanillate catabolism